MVEAVDHILTTRDDILRILQVKLTKAQKRMKPQANKHLADKAFEEGDWVYLKLQPYRELFVKETSHKKLSERYYGPFTNLKKINI